MVNEDLVFTTDRALLIAKARMLGMSDEDILRIALGGERAGNRRRQIVVEWGEAIGLEASVALRKAQRAGLIPSVHPPRGKKAGKPPDKARGK